MKNSIFLDYKFWKVQGAGNDFIIFDARKSSSHSESQRIFLQTMQPETVSRLCARRFGVGADGIVLIKDDNDHDFGWEFYNADGSLAEMCGNAARCVSLVGFEILNLKKTLSFRTLVGVVTASKTEEKGIAIEFEIANMHPTIFYIEKISGVMNSHFVNAGVPHLVLELDHWPAKKEVLNKMRELRRDKTLGPGGANVTLFHRKPGENEPHVYSVTFERGIEGFTLSCGTGVIAAALVSSMESNEKEVSVTNPGGSLIVEKLKNSIVRLSGPCQIIFEGRVHREMLNEIN